MLDIKMEFHRGILFVELDGVLNKRTVALFKNRVIDTFDGVKNIVYDLSKLRSIDIYGIYALHDSCNICKCHDGDLLIYGNDIIKGEYEKYRRIYGRINTSKQESYLCDSQVFW